MPTFAGIEGLLWLFTIVLTTTLLVKFIWTRLLSTYPLFTFLIAVGLVRSLLAAFIPWNRYAYGIFYMASEATLWLLYVMASLEVFSLVFQSYPGIKSMSRWVTTGSLAVAMLLATASLYPDMMAKVSPTPLDVFFIAERGVLFGLAVLIVLLSLFLVWFPMTLSRNVALHSFLFSTYFLTKATAVLLRTVVKTPWGRTSSTAVLVISNLCILLWIVLLRRSGETATVIIGHKWDQSREQELVGQLKAINSSLARAARE